jgi:hypothetical protein
MIISEFLFKILMQSKLMSALLKLSFYQILIWCFYDNMIDLINILNINAVHIKRIFYDIFININC